MHNGFWYVSIVPMETEIRLYEIGYLLKGDIGEEEALEKSEFLRKIIENEKGLIIQENRPKKQNLGYPIKKHAIAYSGSFSFTLAPEKIPVLKKSFEKFDLLRLLLRQSKREKEILKYPAKRRTFRQPPDASTIKEIQQTKEAQKKEPASTSRLDSTETKPAKRSEPLQVEEIDKKLEEILGQ